MGARGGPGARAGPRPAADVQCSRTLEVGWTEVILGVGGPLAARSTSVRSGRPRRARIARLASPGQRPVFQLRAALGGPPRREIVWPSLPSQVFTPDWSGRWEERGGRPRGEPVVAARPARLGASGPAVRYGPPALASSLRSVCGRALPARMKVFPGSGPRAVDPRGSSPPLWLLGQSTRVALVPNAGAWHEWSGPFEFGGTKKPQSVLEVGGREREALSFLFDLPLTTIREKEENPGCRGRCLLLKLTEQIEQAFQL